MNQHVTLMGLDIGTTTASAMFATARLQQTGTGHIELDELHEVSADTIFTPYQAEQLFVDGLLAWIDGQFERSQISPTDVFGGGALITGLAAERENSAQLTARIHERLEDAVVATATDPRFEAWLAFMAAAAAVSRGVPGPVINLDIGGGTTNVALGEAGQVLATGSIFIGARHLQVTQGTYQIERISRHARRMFEVLGIAKSVGQQLEPAELKALVGFYVEALEAVVTGNSTAEHAKLVTELVQAPLSEGVPLGDAIVTLSGGVGELVYQQATMQGQSSQQTPFGDLGLDLASAILRSPLLGKDAREHIPARTGRATVFGLLRHATQVSGTTIYLTPATQLPLRDVPILGVLKRNTTDEQLSRLGSLTSQSQSGGCLIVDGVSTNAPALKTLAERIAHALESHHVEGDKPLVLIAAANVGKSLGSYITAWGTRQRNLLVLDELVPRDAQFVRVGRTHEHLVPVSFYGMN